MRAGKKLILVVEDDEAALQLFVSFFQAHGYKTLAAPSALDALPLLSGEIDAIVTDDDMPGLSGSDFRALVKKRLPAVPVICITGLEGAERERLGTIFDVVLYKPFRLKDLGRVVDRTINP